MSSVTFRREDTMKRGAEGLRKGSWTREEDILLRNCVEKYGEGKWHLVPVRAGLNRCRKSCRLRWLNYLRPDIKRGFFNRDEVDLIIRLHKLLGNRWSLIAGRLPGRTANDVKNFWNTHIDKKSVASAIAASTPTFPRECNHCCKTNKIINAKTSNNNIIIKPRPRNFFKPQQPPPTVSDPQLMITNGDEENTNKKTNPSPTPKNKPSLNGDTEILNGNNHQQCSSWGQQKTDECVQWWKNLLEMSDSGDVEKSIPSADRRGDCPQIEMPAVFSLPDLSENSCWDTLGFSSLCQNDHMVDRVWEFP